MRTQAVEFASKRSPVLPSSAFFQRSFSMKSDKLRFFA